VKPLADHHEFVAGQPGDGVGAPPQRAQPAGDRPEHLVAGMGAEGVVDRLEAVQIDEKYG
jgi:hypothetical protein